MIKVPLNSDMLNDCESIYFQIDRFAFLKFRAEATEDFLSFFSECYKVMMSQGIKHKSLFIPFNIYNNIICLMNNNPLFDLTDTFECALKKNIGIVEKNIVVYVPDAIKEKVKL